MEFPNEKEHTEGMSTQGSSLSSVQHDTSRDRHRWYTPDPGVIVVEAGHSYMWYRRHQKYQTVFVLVSCAVFCLLFLAGYWIPLLTAQATITIRPKQTTVGVSPILPLTLSPSPTLNGKHIRTRILPVLTLSQTLVVHASGHDYTQSSPAHGFITFHNQSSRFHVIPAHTLLITNNGTRVVTDQEANLPAAASSTQHGWSTVPAHVFSSAQGGSIQPYALAGSCCAPGVSFLNYWPFTGERAPVVSSILTASDVDHSIAPIRPTLDASLHAALATQLHHGEMLLVPTTCALSSLLSHPVGSHVSSAILLVQERCPQAQAVNTQDVQAVLSTLLIQHVLCTEGNHYHRVSEIHVEVGAWETLPTSTRGTVSLPVKASATWNYVLQPGEGQKMIQQVLGKKRDDAERQLRRHPGIHDVSITISGLEQDTLPLFSHAVHFAVQQGSSNE